MTITISVGESRRSTNWTPREVTWEQLCRKLQTPVRTSETMAEYAAMTKDQRAEIKDVGGYVGGRIESGHRKAGNISDRQLICLDADFADESLWDVWELMVGKAALMHSSHSSIPEKPRFRLVIPLSRPVSAAEYEPIARRLAEWVGIDAFDDTTYEAERLMYWGSCCADAEYVFRKSESEDWVNPDEVLATYEDWHDMRQWPTSSRQTEITDRLGRMKGDPLTKPGVIGAFNRAYRITEAIEKFLPDVYSPAGEGRWTYNGGTTTGGAVSYDDDTFLYSHHDTDPIRPLQGVNAYDLVRVHKFGHLDAGSDAEFGVEMPSAKAMNEWAMTDEKVVAEMRSELIERDPAEVFDPVWNGMRRFEGDYSEHSVALDFAARYKDMVHHANGFGWMLWDGTRWVLYADAYISQMMMSYLSDCYGHALADMKMAIASGAKDKIAKAKQIVKVFSGYRTAAKTKALLTDVAAMLHEDNTDQYDGNAWELNTPNGVIDLTTGNLLNHDPEKHHTKCTICSPGSEGAEKWADFIDYITDGDQDFARYLQTLAGMAAVGEVLEENFVIVYGRGGNGKSTFFNTLGRVMGDYACTVNTDAIVNARGGSDSALYLACLRGTRLALMSETEAGHSMGAATLKKLSSKDQITSRVMYYGELKFWPKHTAIMHTNHLPRLTNVDDAVRRRIAVAPFPATLPPEKVITNYDMVLFNECGPAVMSWIIKGAVMFHEAGDKLVKAQCVKRVTDEYLQEEDEIARFLEEKFDEGGPDDLVSGKDMLTAYQIWLGEQGQTAPTRGHELARALTEKGIGHKKTRNGRFWTGLKLREDL